MKTINLKRVGIAVILIILLVLFFQKCVNDKLNVLKGEYNILKENYEHQKNIVDSLVFLRQKQKDSLEFEILKRESKNTVLQEENTALKNKIKDINNTPIKVPKTLQELAEYFNLEYSTNENNVVENKVGLGQNTATEVVVDLQEGKKAIEIVPLQDSIIKNQDSVISNLNKDKENLSLVISSAENELEERKKLQEMADKNINNLETQVRKQKRKSFWDKVLIISAGVGGFIIGNQIN